MVWRLLASCMVLVFTTITAEWAAAATVRGVVTGPDGRPMGGVRVYLEDTLLATVTGPDGTYELDDVPAGDYLLTYVQFTMATERRAITLGAEDRMVVDQALSPNPHWLKAAAAYTPPEPERLAHKQAYLDAVPPAPAGAPNVVVIFFDDMGYGDLSSYGNRLIQTPQIDRLAEAGVRLTEFYASSSVCTPSRAGLLTGRYPVRMHASDYVFFPEGHPVTLLRRVQGFPNALLRDEILLPEILAAAGYRTAMIGKWHLGDRDGHLPGDFGFASYYGVRFSNDMQPLHIWRDSTIEVPAGEVDQRHLTRLYTDEAVTFVQATDDRPFFLYLAHTFPHVPHFADADHVGRSDAGLYGDVIGDLDRSVGRVVEALRARGLADNTLVVVTSDNGGDTQASVGDLRGRKSETFEGGMRVPAIFHWPDRLPAGRTVGGMAMNIDILPTVLATLGIAPPADRVIDGRDILPMLATDAGSPHDRLFYFSGWFARLEAVRDDRYKYRLSTQKPVANLLHPYPVLPFTPYTEAMLTDLVHDREAHDLSARHPAKLAELQAAIEAMQADLAENLRGWIDTD